MTDDVAARYARPPRRALRLVASVVGAALALVVFGSVTANVLADDLRWREVSFDTDADQVSVTFEVTGGEGETVRCQVRASDARYADVGQLDVDLGPLPREGLSRTVTLRTIAPAVTASVRTCVVLPDGLS